MQKSLFFKGTIILTMTGLLSRIIGFFYRILLSHTIGAAGMGIYQLIFPIQGLFLALTASGFQVSISRHTAAKYAKKDKNGAIGSFFTGTAISLLLSGIAAYLLYHGSETFGRDILKEARTVPLLIPLALSLPLSALHGCINSYYYGMKKPALPSFIQLIEQGVRVLSVCLLCRILVSEGKAPTPSIAVHGILISEIIAVLFSVLVIGVHIQKSPFSLKKLPPLFQSIREIGEMAVPLTANRVLLTLLASMEVVLIPQRLQKFGLSSSEALSIYGVFTGMALPLILFPTTLTNSVGTMLLPSIAELQTLGQKGAIRRAVHRIIQFCLFLGISCGMFYFFFGKQTGLFLFHNEDVGIYLRIMSFICPFLYLNSTLSSVLNGLGKAGSCLIHNALAISIRIFFVVNVIPIKGIQGYLWGILAGELTLTLMHVLALRQFLFTEQK